MYRQTGSERTMARLRVGRTGDLLPAAAMIILFTTAAFIHPPPLPIEWVPGFFPPQKKRKRLAADHLPLSSAEVKDARTLLHSTARFMAQNLVKQVDFFFFVA
jgi:hypothetical protein